MANCSSALLTRGLLPLGTQGQLFWQFSTVNCCQKTPKTLSERCQLFTLTLIQCLCKFQHSQQEHWPTKLSWTYCYTTWGVKGFLNHSKPVPAPKQAGAEMPFLSAQPPHKVHPKLPIHAGIPQHPALAQSSQLWNSSFQKGQHHQTGVFSSFATKLRLTWKWPCLGHLSFLPGENVLVWCHWDGTIWDYIPEHRVRDSQVHWQTCSWADLP